MLRTPQGAAVSRLVIGLMVLIWPGGSHALGLTPRLVLDINPFAESSSVDPSQFFDFGGVAVFVGGDRQLWRSDGTPGGTWRIKEINPTGYAFRPAPPSGTAGYSPWWTVMNGQLYFVADDGVHGTELWKTDGTTDGTTLVKDIKPGSGSSLGWQAFPAKPAFLRGFTVLGNELFFLADDGEHGRELWKTDGTEAGTVLVKDIRAGATASVSSDHMLVANGLVFLIANDGTHGIELWKSDGTADGTQLVMDIFPGAGPGLDTTANMDMAEMGGRLYFAARDTAHGIEPWKTDGTPEGTSMVADVYPGSGSSISSSPGGCWMFPDGQGKLYLSLSGASTTNGLYKTDGTPAGTVLVKSGCVPNYFLSLGSRVICVSSLSATPPLYATDGTTEGTVSLGTLASLGTPGRVMMKIVKDTLFFVGYDTTHGGELWKTDGTPAGTRLVRDLTPVAMDTFAANGYDPSFAEQNGMLLFVAEASLSSPRGSREVWRSDGTAEGTTQVTYRPNTLGDGPAGLVTIGGITFFSSASATLGTTYKGLWISDGTTAGTIRLPDSGNHTSGSSPGPFFELNGAALFSADDGSNGRELWKTNGTASGTAKLKEIRPGVGSGNPQGFVWVGDAYLFEANDGEHGYELWRTDGTVDGTYMVKDINPGPGHGMPLSWIGGTTDVAVLNGKAYFVANDGVHGYELWCSDGTAAGTGLVAELVPGAGGLVPTWNGFAVGGGLLYFSVDTADASGVLWRTDGTAGGTFMLRADSTWDLECLGGTLLFSARDATNGQELWRSDGTVAGTRLLKDLVPGAMGSNPDGLIRMGAYVLFTTWNSSSSHVLWRTDGTAAGTVAIHEFQGDPEMFFAAEGQALFAVYPIPSGADWGVWRTDGTPDGTYSLSDENHVPYYLGSPVDVAGRVVFGSYEPYSENIWVSDGTRAGTKRLTGPPVPPYAGGGAGFTLLGNALVFRARATDTGSELWAMDLDEDGDGVLAVVDNCPDTLNPDQADADGDRVGDACDSCSGTVPGASVDAGGCPPLIPGDFNRDGDVDGDDLGVFSPCMLGATVSPASGCESSDLDHDTDVDQDDFGLFQRCLSGTNKPANPGCGQ